MNGLFSPEPENTEGRAKLAKSKHKWDVCGLIEADLEV